MSREHEKLVLLERNIIDGEPVRAVSYLQPDDTWDSGFMLFSSPPEAADRDTAVMCLQCVLAEWPDIGRGLDVARDHGEAIRNGNEWLTSV